MNIRQALSDLPAPSGRLAAALEALETGLVERRLAVRLALLAALAGEHILLIGPPGTAKSALARRLHLAFAEGRYFERLLTRFSVPEELFGPLSIRALEEDRYERHTAGFLPDATIAFIDEVFKANSAILNALLTLLNEREFDNGAGRQPCPLVSVIGATNAVPEDEVGEAFLDRFLVRLPVGPVSEAGFAELLALPEDTGPPPFPPMTGTERQTLAAAARAVALPAEVAALMAELRGLLAAEEPAVSDRRWVKVLGLLRTAAAAEGRSALVIWDLWLLPWCLAPDVEGQTRLRAWLAGRLGVREAISPPLLTRVVEAFEAQLDAEQRANDLDYDEAGRLRFGDAERAGGVAAELAEEFGDAKGGAQALRMSYTRRRRYGERHIAARLAQLGGVLTRIAAYAGEVAAHAAGLEAYAAASLWLDPSFAGEARASLAATAEAIAALKARAEAARTGFLALPRLEGEAGTVPAAVEHEVLPA